MFLKLKRYFSVLDKANGRSARGERLKTANLRTARGQHPGLGTSQPQTRRRPCRRQETY